MSDEDLMLAILRGDKTALTTFIKKYQDQVVNTCIKVLHNRQDAEEAAQETFLEAYRSMPMLRHEPDIAIALKGLSLKKAESLRRKRRVMNMFFSSEGRAAVSLLAEIPDEQGFTADPVEKMEDEERRLLIFKSLDSLSVNQRKAFILHHFEGISYKDIAGIMGISLSSVESLIFRALANLKKRCGNYVQFEESVTKDPIV